MSRHCRNRPKRPRRGSDKRERGEKQRPALARKEKAGKDPGKDEPKRGKNGEVRQPPTLRPAGRAKELPGTRTNGRPA